MTTKLCPSHPVVDNRSKNRGPVSESIPNLGLITLILTISTPCFVFILHDNLPQTRWESMLIIVYDGLSDVQRSLTDHVLELLPTTVGWNLHFQ